MTRKRVELTNGRLADAHHHMKRKPGIHFPAQFMFPMPGQWPQVFLGGIVASQPAIRPISKTDAR